MADILRFVKDDKLNLRGQPDETILAGLFLDDDPAKDPKPEIVTVRSVSLRNMPSLTRAGLQLIAKALGGQLEKLYLRACSGLDDAAVMGVIDGCPGIKVLSLAGVRNVSDRAVTHALARLALDELYLAGTSIGLATLHALAGYQRGARKELDMAGICVSPAELLASGLDETGLKAMLVQIAANWTDITEGLFVGKRI